MSLHSSNCRWGLLRLKWLTAPIGVSVLLLSLWIGLSLLVDLPVQAQTESSISCEREQVTQIPQQECEALVAFYKNTNGAGWLNNTNWLQTETICTSGQEGWYGVYCTVGGDPLRHVVRIELPNNGLQGSIPPEIENLTELVILSLNNNGLSGSIPLEIGQLSKLVRLELSENKLEKGIPPTLGKLTLLVTLNLSHNSLTGSIPEGLGRLVQLEHVNLEVNRLTGRIPEMYTPNLEYLALNRNLLEGPIPASFGTLKKIHTLYLYRNALEGTLPAGFEGIGSSIPPTTPLRLDINNNRLSCNDDKVCGFLNTHQPDWHASQTVPPKNLRVGAINATDVTLLWDPIPFSAGAGYYEIEYTTSLSAPYRGAVQTASKQDSAVLVPNLCPGQSYTFTQRTYTPSHSDQKNSLWSSYSQPVVATTAPRAVDLLLLPILAIDSNLDTHYNDYIAGIAEATARDPRIMALVLADRSAPADPDTRILKIQCGEVERLPGLPNLDLSAALLDTDLREYDMTNPRQLAAFITWARTTLGGELPAGVPNAIKTVVSYVGHGLPLAPATDISQLISKTVGLADAADVNPRRGGLPPAPTKIPATPDQLTDQTSLTLISPYSLTQALSLTTNNGVNPITVLDIVHCFGGTIEELYELSNPSGQPVAEMVVTSPNYTYAGAATFTKMLLAINAMQTARQMAEAMVAAYEAALAEADSYDNNPNSVDHPRILVAIEMSKVAAIKVKIDELATNITRHFAADQSENRTTTRERLKAAHQATGIYYDTIPTSYPNDQDPTQSCPHDYRLTAHDGLADLTSFVGQLPSRFNDQTITEAVSGITAAVNNALVTRTHKSGVPWFANNPSLEPWRFDNASGIALYTDFQGVVVNGITYIGWQAHWYTNTISIDNPHPYQFVQGEVTWANVIQAYWADQLGQNGVKTLACVTQLPQVRRPENRYLYLPLIVR